jgi:hypothetical protein
MGAHRDAPFITRTKLACPCSPAIHARRCAPLPKHPPCTSSRVRPRSRGRHSRPPFDVEIHNATPLVGEDHQHEEHSERHGGDYKKSRATRSCLYRRPHAYKGPQRCLRERYACEEKTLCMISGVGFFRKDTGRDDHPSGKSQILSHHYSTENIGRRIAQSQDHADHQDDARLIANTAPNSERSGP